MKRYAWNLIDTDGDRISGPRHSSVTTPNARAMEQDDDRFFRLLDDDGNVSATGGFRGDWQSEDGFGPLDDYGTPALGATAIEYRDPESGLWEML